MIKTAKKYLTAGLSVIGCRDKRPTANSWSQYRTTPATEAELDKQFKRGADQIAVICGYNGLEVIDIDTKNSTDPQLLDKVLEDITDLFNGNLSRFYITRTASGGGHIYYRTEKPEGNQKLASETTGVIIETRGAGGYVIAPPSPGYTTISGDIATIGELTEAERADLLDTLRAFNKVIKHSAQAKPAGTPNTTYKLTPWDDYNSRGDWRQVLHSEGWEEITALETKEREYWKRPGTEAKTSANFHKEKNLFFCWSTSTPLEAEKGITPFEIYTVYKHGGDFKAAAKALRTESYGQPWRPSDIKKIDEGLKYALKGMDETDLAEMLAFDPDIFDTETKKKILNTVTAKAKAHSGAFWTTTKTGIVKLLEDPFVELLKNMGFRLFSDEENTLAWRPVQVDPATHIIREVSRDMIKKAVKKWIHDPNNLTEYDLDRQKLINAITGLTETYWNGKIEWLPRMEYSELKFIRDDKNTAWLFYKNSAVKITKKNIAFIPYNQLPEGTVIWASQIKDTNIEKVNLEKADMNRIPWYRFIKRLAGITPDQDHIDPLSLEPETVARLTAWITTAGYLLTNYKNPSTPYCIVISEDTDDQGSGGGTGKGLFIKGLSFMREICTLPGKEWNNKKNFAWQTVKLGTDVISIDDTPQYFDIKAIYNVITEGLTLEKKGKDALTIPYQYSPKIVLTTNYDVTPDGDHGFRRLKRVAAARYFNRNYSPMDEFNHLFFDDWTPAQWQDFYNLNFYFIQEFLEQGVQEMDLSEAMKIKAVKNKAGQEFYDFMTAWMYDYKIGTEVVFSDFYEEFLTGAQVDARKWSKKRLGHALTFYAEIYDLDYFRNTKRITGDTFIKVFAFYQLGQEGEKAPEMPNF